MKKKTTTTLLKTVYSQKCSVFMIVILSCNKDKQTRMLHTIRHGKIFVGNNKANQHAQRV